MKRFLILSITVMLASFQTAPAWAGGYSHDPGCGLGSEIFKSGSLGCTNNGHFAQNEQTTLFANLNFDNLSQEMAQGGAESTWRHWRP